MLRRIVSFWSGPELERRCAALVLVCLAVGVVLGAASALADRSDGLARYREVAAMVVSEPSMFSDGDVDGVQARVRVVDSDLETTTAVSDDAQLGDRVTAYLDTETATLARLTEADATPYPSLADVVIAAGFAGALFAGAALLFIVVVWHVDVARQQRHVRV